ncbi:hypothetical protein BT93_J0169 [Corymbia citriodora subsp. variegata]|nr:hypothetical protein BT93_J0169 [Corymbia citriodora subsp. variegata]
MRFIQKIDIDPLCNCLLCGYLPFHSIAAIYLCMMKWLSLSCGLSLIIWKLKFPQLEVGTFVFIASSTEYDGPVQKHTLQRHDFCLSTKIPMYLLWTSLLRQK